MHGSRNATPLTKVSQHVALFSRNILLLVAAETKTLSPKITPTEVLVAEA